MFEAPRLGSLARSQSTALVVLPRAHEDVAAGRWLAAVRSFL